LLDGNNYLKVLIRAEAVHHCEEFIIDRFTPKDLGLRPIHQYGTIVNDNGTISSCSVKETG